MTNFMAAFRSYVKLYNVNKNTPSTSISLAPKNKENIFKKVAALVDLPW